METFAEGENCYVMSHGEDWRQLATIVVLKAGRDGSGNDIVVTAEDKDAVKLYGKRNKTFTETRWTTNLLAQLRALQLLEEYSTPAITLTLDAEPALLDIGEAVSFTSASMGIDGVFYVRSLDYSYGDSGETMTVRLSNKLTTFADLFDMIQRQIDKR